MANTKNNSNKHNESLLKAVDKHVEQIKCHLLRLEPTTAEQVDWKNAAIENIKITHDGILLWLRRAYQ